MEKRARKNYLGETEAKKFSKLKKETDTKTNYNLKSKI